MPFTRYIASGLVLFAANISTMAQDSLQMADEERNLALMIGTDYGKLVTTAFKLDTRYEFNLSLQFSKRLRLTADYGYGALEPANAIENGTYRSEGDYYRAGLDYQIKIAAKIYLSMGAMYAGSFFNDEGTVEIQSEVWPSLKENFVREAHKAQWAEWVLTSEAPVLNRESGVFSNLYWGIKFRLRFMIERPEPEQFDIYAIPGYGRTFNNVVPAVNLFIAYKWKW